jgi:hypothetical protein
MAGYVSNFPTTPVDYHSIGGPVEPDTFLSPRHKIWAIFITDARDSLWNKGWLLVKMTNSITEVRKLYDEFLRNPPANNATNKMVGMDNIIACEILPTDFVSRIGAL